MLVADRLPLKVTGPEAKTEFSCKVSAPMPVLLPLNAMEPSCEETTSALPAPVMPPWKLILPTPAIPVERTVKASVSVVADTKVMSSAVALTVPWALMPPAPVSVTAPVEVISPPVDRLSTPLVAFKVTGPDSSVVTGRFRIEIAEALMFTPRLVSVIRPRIEVVPLPAVCVNEPTFIR